MKDMYTDVEMKKQTTKVKFGLLAEKSAKKTLEKRTRSTIACLIQLDHKTIPERGASTIMFKSVLETKQSTYEEGSITMLYLATGDEPISGLGVGELMLKEL